MTLPSTPMLRSSRDSSLTWTTRGFDAFRKGSFGNGGQNLYVSRNGILQRIHHHDVNADGHMDLLFCNSQNHWEIPPSYVYQWQKGKLAQVELPYRGTSGAAIADINGDGVPDLILGAAYNGIGFDNNAVIYYGQPAQNGAVAWRESAMQLLPIPNCQAIAAGDFNGDGRMELAMASLTYLRLFPHGPLGPVMKEFTDLPVAVVAMTSADLDGDGCDELIVRFASGRVRIYWGGADGVQIDRSNDMDMPGDAIADELPADDERRRSVEWLDEPHPHVRVLHVAGEPHVFIARSDRAWLVPVRKDRTLGNAIAIGCANAMSAALHDMDGDGHADLVIAARTPDGSNEYSSIYWGTGAGSFATDPARLPTWRATDVAIGDFDHDGVPEVAICQGFTADHFTTTCPIYKFDQRSPVAWQQVEAHDSRSAFAVSNTLGDQLIVTNRQGRNRIGNIPATIYLGSADGYAPDRKIDLPGWGSTIGVMADFDDDGVCDIALANAAENSVDRDPGSYIYLQSNDGFGKVPSQILPTRRAHGIACADIDHDGELELIFAGFCNSELLIFHHGPNGFDTDNPTRLQLELDGKTYDQQRYFYLADLNNDGWLDLVLPLINADHSLILWGGPDGYSMKNSQKLSVWHGSSARAADLDGDGYLDLIIGGHMASAEIPHDSFVHIYWNGPDGLREDRKTLLPAEAVNSISIADFNNDGHLDLFAGSYQQSWKKRDSESFIFWNRGGRGFSSRDFTRLFTHSASGDIAADFNEDGYIDLAIATHKIYGDHQALSQVWWNGPGGFDEKRITWLPTSGPHGMQSPGPGNQMDRGPEEFYTSEAHAMPIDRLPDRITWQATLGPKTWVKAQIRVASSEQALASAPWIGAAGAGTWLADGEAIAFNDASDASNEGDPQACWMQYRLALGATNGGSTPRVSEVQVHFR